ncbi:tryptophan synthase subunit alpha [Colwellia sp. 1_MG-2023]|uniref:tryptophan synthase subunit alpha n=1 Tax=Colwellia sp. 1_MG-2023 TaxID=3062649 RepID=UPI0026E1EA0B|nr:tryptophan synthase subunit alpha [Colwellia sp. 1_MG-2023]MDO6445952.1 tryptophan synthase subunit alpha [Colwellia sp. 1_MG-2023]
MTQLQAQNQKAGQRYIDCFHELSAKNEGAFIPFVAIGDPNPEQSLAIIKTLIDAGADALELGIPFSDPSADGIIIQEAGKRAIATGTNTDVCLDILKQIREYAPQIPIGLLLYGNLVFARGINKFYQDMANAGVDSILIADLPIRESEQFRNAALGANIAPIFIAPPNASEETLQKVAAYSHGYTYVLSRAGVTGVDAIENETSKPTANVAAHELIASLKNHQAAPAVIGFGISQPQQVKDALNAGAAGAISGSAVVKIIENHLSDNTAMLSALHEFVSSMKAATKQ